MLDEPVVVTSDELAEVVADLLDQQVGAVVENDLGTFEVCGDAM